MKSKQHFDLFWSDVILVMFSACYLFYCLSLNVVQFFFIQIQTINAQTQRLQFNKKKIITQSYYGVFREVSVLCSLIL